MLNMMALLLIVVCIFFFRLHAWRTALVNMIANFIADVLEHPRVQVASANIMVAGMNATADQPDLPERAATIYLKLQEQNEHVSRQLGEQFPKVAASFLAGAAAGLRKKDNKQAEGVKKVESEKKDSAPSTPLRAWGSLFVKKDGPKDEPKKSSDAWNSSAAMPLLPTSSFQSQTSSDAGSVDERIKAGHLSTDSREVLENKKES